MSGNACSHPSRTDAEILRWITKGRRGAGPRRFRPGGEQARPGASAAAAAAAVVDVDLLAPDLLGHGLLVDLHVLVEAHALLRHGALLDDRLLLVKHDLVLLLGDVGSARRRVDVGVGDRLAIEADFLALDRDSLRRIV